mmetsp:Transcript_12992/g.48168  ORF Transcript_12992/g.48168 Transcript_12992/m.48168 type:complete len:300 (+) Transcript_12992:355-1254(+)
MVRDEHVRVEHRGVLLMCRLEVLQAALLRRICDLHEALEALPGVLHGLLSTEDAGNLARLIPKDLAQNHVANANDSTAVLALIIALEGLEEVAVARVIVLFLAVELPRHLVQLRLQHRRDVHAVRRCAARRESRFGLGEVPQCMVQLGFHQVRVQQQLLVVQLLQLPQKSTGGPQAFVVLSGEVLHVGKARLHPVAQEGPILPDAPLNHGLGQVDLHHERVRHFLHHVQDAPDDLGGLGLGNAREERAVAEEQILQPLHVPHAAQHLGQEVHRSLLGLQRALAVVTIVENRAGAVLDSS